MPKAERNAEPGWPCPKCGEFQPEYQETLLECYVAVQWPAHEIKDVDPRQRVCLNQDCGHKWIPDDA